MEVSFVSNSYNTGYSFAFSTGGVDNEEKEIMARLLAYGLTPTGDKQTDKNMLHKVELEKVRQEVNSSANADSVSTNKYLTVSQGELNSLIGTKKEHKKENETYNDMHKLRGNDILASYNQMLVKRKKDLF